MLLHKAVQENDIFGVKKHLKDGFDVNAKDKRGNIALHFVHDEEIASLLVRSSSDLNTRNDNGETALHNACISPFDNFSGLNTNILCSRLKIMTILLEAGACPNIQNQLGYSALHSLFVYGGIAGLGMDLATIRDAVLMLLKYNANPGLEDFEGCTALHHAVREPNLASVVELLLDAGADVNAKDRRGMTPLHYIFDLDDEEMANLLLHHEGSINEKDINGATVLSSAVLAGNEFMIQLLLQDPRTEINLGDLNGITPLHLAAAYKYIEVCEMLIAYGADINAHDAWNATPLHYAAYGGTPEIVSLLLLANASHKTKDDLGYLPIQYALDRHYFHTALAFGKDCEQEVKAHLSTSEKIDETTELQDWVLQSFPSDDVLTIIVPASKVYSDPCNKDILPPDTMDYIKTKTIHNSSAFVRGMTEVPGIGRIPDIEEAKAIKATIENYIEKLSSTMAGIDSRFCGSLLQSGSVYEGTKICDPCEFDYMLCLEKFKQVCSIELDEKTQFDNIRVSKAASFVGNNHFDDLFDEDQLQSDKVMNVFVEVARKAISKLGFATGSSNLYFQSLTEHTLVEGTWILSGTVTCNLQFIWNGLYYKQLVICVDLVPAIHISNWPCAARKEGSLLTDNITSKGCHVVSKSGYWRLSFSLAEKMIMEGLSSEQKLAFVGAKVMLHAAVSAKITIYDDTALDEATDLSNQDCSKEQQDGGMHAGDKHELASDAESSSCFGVKSFPPDELQTQTQNDVSASSDTKVKGPTFSGTIFGRMMTSSGSPVTVIKASDKQILQNFNVGDRVEVTVKENQVTDSIDNCRSRVSIPRIKGIGDASTTKGYDVGDGAINDDREGNAKAKPECKLDLYLGQGHNTTLYRKKGLMPQMETHATDDANAEGQDAYAIKEETIESSRVKLGDVTDVDLEQGKNTTIEFGCSEESGISMEKNDDGSSLEHHDTGDINVDTHENAAEMMSDMTDIFLEASQSDEHIDDKNQSNSDIPTKTFEPRDVLSTYLLKMVFFHCLEENSNISPEMVVTTEQIFRQIYDYFKDEKHLPYYFMQSHNLMDKMLQSEDSCETKLTLMMLNTFLSQKS